MTYRIPVGVLCALAVAGPALAQTEADTIHAKIAAELQAQTLAVAVPRMAVESRVTTGRPYSAEATTEFVQVLGDGNRISKKTTVRIFRDSEGRTRREELGAGDVVESIAIYVPVAHVSYILDPKNRTAMKTEMRIVYPPAERAGMYTMGMRGRGGRGGQVAVVTPDAPREAGAEMVDKREAEELIVRGNFQVRGTLQVDKAAALGGAMPTAVRARSAFAGTTESLGEQVMDGVAAAGSRTTTTIPAGAIGNQQEIRVVSEQWFSADLQVLVMTRHSDPRSGETTYRLTNIIRADPGAALFEVPADYTVKESAGFSIKRDPALQ
jgi:hypothetical protein